MEADAAVLVAARVAAREQQDAKNRLQAEELARRKLEKKVASLTAQKMCEDCGEKRPNWGLMEEKKKRWCGPCAKSHEGAVYITAQKMCEDCGKKQPSFGHLDIHKKRWCGPCAKSHEGAVYIPAQKMCEDWQRRHRVSSRRPPLEPT